MKKIININFHSRVIPIEETAYDILRKYVESLKKHFAGEEGGDEIVNDIEDRFAELFSDRLKKGATCITDADVEEIITSMGRPEDFDQDENTQSNGPSAASSAYADEEATETTRRLYRSENDKMLGGICGGLAAYLKIDPAFVRIIYALLILGSFGTALFIYIILWVVLPPKSMVTKIRKRLFRDPDHRVIGGVASGLAAYFNIEVWIPRVIFCLPLIAGVITSVFNNGWFDVFGGPVFFTGGFGGALFTTYIILWIVLPEAKTASEKLEMRGEKIDLESIKNTIKSDLEGFRQKATAVGGDFKQKAEKFGNDFKTTSGNIRSDIASARRPAGIGHAIGVLFKAFFLFISVIITFGLVMGLIGLIFTGAGVLPLKDYVISGFWQNIMAWCVLLFFLILPVVALLTWLIRRIIGVRRGSHYLGYVFGSLWVVGLVSLIILTATISRNFTVRTAVQEKLQLANPSNGKMIVKMDESKSYYLNEDWMGVNWRHGRPFFDVTEDSLTLNTVRINVIKSKDSAWHIQLDKLGRGSNNKEAAAVASEIHFTVSQQDSLLLMPHGFGIRPREQFRNQQVLVLIEMPVGKKIMLDESLEDFKWFNINRKWRNNGINVDWDSNDNFADDWDADVEYIMTENGLERTHKIPDTEEEEDNDKPARPSENRSGKDSTNGEYRYHKEKTASVFSTEDEETVNEHLKVSGMLTLLASIF